MTPIAEPSACQDPKASIGAVQARPRMLALQDNRTTNCCRRQRFSAISSAFGLKIAAMAETSNRKTCGPSLPSFQQERRAGHLSML
jgi:hypothetical protein